MKSIWDKDWRSFPIRNACFPCGAEEVDNTAGSRDLGCIPSPVPFQLYDLANSCEVYMR